MEDKCVACNEYVDDGFALGRLCYHCIEEVVIAFKKGQNIIKHNEFAGMVIQDFYCNGFFGRDYDLEDAVIISNDNKLISIQKTNNEIVQTNIEEYDAKTIRRYIEDWTKVKEY